MRGMLPAAYGVNTPWCLPGFGSNTPTLTGHTANHHSLKPPYVTRNLPGNAAAKSPPTTRPRYQD